MLGTPAVTPHIRLRRCAVLVILLGLTGVAAGWAKPKPGVPRSGFRIFARAQVTFGINRVYCDLLSDGEICTPALLGGGGGLWPRGTPDQYVFNSGLQVAGVVGPDGGPWADDTTGAFFFDSRGDQQNAEQVEPIYNMVTREDRALAEAGADAVSLAARVPSGDASELLYDPLLRGRATASQGDVWWLSWEGNPALSSGRPHPLGLLAEYRGLGWNYPAGNEDIIYFIITFYNITSLDPAAYAAVRPGMRDILLAQAKKFHILNDARLDPLQLPAAGYTIQDMFVSFAADMDVADPSDDYGSVNVPFSLGFIYSHAFERPGGWTFDPSIFSSPFFAGSGFAGVKYLKSPEVNGQEVGLTLFTTFTYSIANVIQDPAGVKQLYRYQRAAIDPSQGDGACNTGAPQVTHICFINDITPADMRFFQASGPLTLAPGEFSSIAVAYIFAAPVAVGGCSAPCDVTPGDPRVFLDPFTASQGNTVDSMTGYQGFLGDLNSNSTVDQEELLTAPGSLLGKASVAQVVFDNEFLLPFTPDPPDFFLIPGDDAVTVMWRPSNSETAGDPYFAVASQASNAGVPNPLYDPNYRQFDVEGYRIYRGRVDAPNSLKLLAQFDYGGTVISDFAGQVNPTALCAPEIAITIDCPVVFDPIAPGVGRTTHVDIPLVGPIIQVKLGERTALASGEAIVLIADTALTGKAGTCDPSACPQLSDNGVPFVYTDNTPRNNFRYFYSVTAFDINSFQSGPSNLESPRITKSVTPVRPATNYQNSGRLTSVTIQGRGVTLDPTQPLPTIDGTTGAFSGPFPPTGSWLIGFGDFVSTVLSEPGNFSAHLDSIQLGDPYNGAGVPHLYWWTAHSGNSATVFSVPVLQTQEIGVRTGASQFAAVPVDPALASRFGGGVGFFLQGKVTMRLSGSDYANLYGRGCVNTRDGYDLSPDCAYNGSRWFDGPSPATNETVPNPNRGNPANFSGTAMADFNNAGALTGVATIHNTLAYETVGGGEYRPVQGVQSGAHRAADFNVYWGAAGAVDSVIDVTHNVVVPFDTGAGGNWGILNQAAAQPFAGAYDARTQLTNTDMGCVVGLRNKNTNISLPCAAAGLTYKLSPTAVPGPIAMFSQSLSHAKTDPQAANNGFVFYLAGDWFTFEMQGGLVPAQGAVWSLRQYIGAIQGGGCATCGAGQYAEPYTYSNPEGILPATAVGIDLLVSFDVTNQVNAATDRDLTHVHTVPDPYYVTSEFENTSDVKQIKFVNLPQDAIIRIYSSSGVLLRILEHHSTTFGGEETWDVRNRNQQVVASGVYFYHIEAGTARRVGRFTVVNWSN